MEPQLVGPHDPGGAIYAARRQAEVIEIALKRSDIRQPISLKPCLHAGRHPIGEPGRVLHKHLSARAHGLREELGVVAPSGFQIENSLPRRRCQEFKEHFGLTLGVEGEIGFGAFSKGKRVCP
jgi:hypothetical protein